MAAGLNQGGNAHGRHRGMERLMRPGHRRINLARPGDVRRAPRAVMVLPFQQELDSPGDGTLDFASSGRRHRFGLRSLLRRGRRPRGSSLAQAGRPASARTKPQRHRTRILDPSPRSSCKMCIACPLSFRERVRVRAGWPKDVFSLSCLWLTPPRLAPRPARQRTTLQASRSTHLSSLGASRKIFSPAASPLRISACLSVFSPSVTACFFGLPPFGCT